MKTRYFILAAACALATFSCQSLKEEWQPVLTPSYGDGAEFVPVDMDAEVNATISQVKALYTAHGTPVDIVDDLVIKGEVTTSDESGNVYREIYIQDATGAICLKLGRSSSYDDFKLGQILYVKCKGLAVGEYGYKDGEKYGAGILQLALLGDGWKEWRVYKENPAQYEADHSQVLYPEMYDVNGKFVAPTEPEYETAYIDLLPIIKKHVFRGKILPAEERIAPYVPTSGEIQAIKDDTQNALVSKLVKLSGLTYGNSDGGKEIFCLFYPDPNLKHSKYESWNRVFLSSSSPRGKKDYTFGITTWALTKLRFKALAEAGTWDAVDIAQDGIGTVGTALTPEDQFGYNRPYKEVIVEHASPQNVSHYFMYSGVEVQIRSSGYARFADVEIPSDVRSGSRSIDVLGILSRYQGSAQFTLLDAYYAGTTDSILATAKNE